MKCGIKEVSELTGVSARTLRYYDQIGLLKPSKTSEAGYRYYGERELEILPVSYTHLTLPTNREV